MMMNKKGMSLMEIIVSTIILALVMTGVLGLFVSGRKHITGNRIRMSGGEVGKFFIDPQQMDVRQDTWNAVGNTLTPVAAFNGVTQTISGTTYTPEYTVSNVNNPAGVSLGIRKSKVRLQWVE